MTDDIKDDPIFHRHGIFGMDFPIPLEVRVEEHDSELSILVNDYLLPTEVKNPVTEDATGAKDAPEKRLWLSQLMRSVKPTPAPAPAPAGSKSISFETTLPIDVLARILRGKAENSPDEQAPYLAAEILAHALYPKFKFPDHGLVWLDDTEFEADYKAVMHHGNWHNMQRRYFVKELLKTVGPLSGSMAECGVYRGDTAFQLCQVAEQYEKRVYLFDSFEGLSDPGTKDGEHWQRGSLTASEDEVEQRLTGFSCFDILKGWIPERFAEVQNERFSFVHIDVDLFQPTLDSLRFFYPRMNPGGLIVLDDHGFKQCPGARAAALEYFQDQNNEVIDSPTGQGLVFAR